MKECHCILSIFGATGDLANRKLLPALYFLEQEKYLKENFKIVAIARKEKTNEQYREEASESIKRFSKRKVNEDVLKKLVSRMHYNQLEISNTSDYTMLKKFIEGISGENCSNCERIFYLAVPSSLFSTVVNNLKRVKLAEHERRSKAYNRVDIFIFDSIDMMFDSINMVLLVICSPGIPQ